MSHAAARKPFPLAVAIALALSGGGASGAERAGVTGSVNPAVSASLGGGAARALVVGSDVFREETVRTDASGRAHLLFLDESSLTVGAASSVVIDRFVYDPASGAGELGLSVGKGVLRFVGGALSKRGGVTIRTPVGNLGVRGAVVLLESGGAGEDTIACLVFGEALIGTSASGASGRIGEHERCLRLTPDGRVEEFGPVDPAWLERMLADLQGPAGDDLSSGMDVPLPADFAAWLRELADEGIRDDMRRDEEDNADAINRDVDADAYVPPPPVEPPPEEPPPVEPPPEEPPPVEPPPEEPPPVEPPPEEPPPVEPPPEEPPPEEPPTEEPRSELSRVG